MSSQVLIDAIARQVAALIAALSTAGGASAPIANRSTPNRGLDYLLWTLIYWEGPLSEAEMRALLAQDGKTVHAVLHRLLEDQRVQVDALRRYRATHLRIPLGEGSGWEAAVLDHVQAMVQTICRRLRLEHAAEVARQEVGGSTYTFEIWPGHPFEAEVRTALKRFRTAHSELRERVDAYNAAHGARASRDQVVLYVGQMVRACEVSATGEA